LERLAVTTRLTLVEHEAKLQDERINLILAQTELEQVENNARIGIVDCM
jgi:hypothetical protein